MNILSLSRKKHSDIGGLSRFFQELSVRFPKQTVTITPHTLYRIFLIPFQKIDVIHLCDATLLPVGVLLKYILHKPLVVSAHGLDLTFPNSVYQSILQRILPTADCIILVSRAAKPLVEKFHIPKTKIRIVYSGVSLTHLQQESPITLPDNTNRLFLLTVGNLVLRKGHVWFITHVLPKLSDEFVYLIVGDGPQKDAIRAAIKKQRLEKRVFLLGRLSNPELSYVFNKSDIYICPNQKEQGNFESFGIANGEAAALGLPVIASDVDGIPELIRHRKNGILVPPRADAFVRTIQTLSDSRLRKHIGQKARQYTLQYFSWEKTVNEYLRIFQKVDYNNTRPR